jgi:hypothetical protein
MIETKVIELRTDWSMITFYWTMIDDRTSKKGISGIYLLLKSKDDNFLLDDD